MQFRIADTFTDSLARLTGDEQKAVKTTAFDLQLNAAAPPPGMQFHKLTKAKDKDFWSVRVNADIRPEEIGVFVRSTDQLSRAERAVRTAGCESVQLDSGSEPAEGRISIATMHLAKGLEFRAVAVAAVEDGIIPLESRIEAVTDEADLEEVYNTERHLLYVACTRARDCLWVSGAEPVSEFLDDFRRR